MGKSLELWPFSSGGDCRRRRQDELVRFGFCDAVVVVAGGRRRRLVAGGRLAIFPHKFRRRTAQVLGSGGFDFLDVLDDLQPVNVALEYNLYMT